MSKQTMNVDVSYTCPVCGKEIKRVKITKEYVRCFNKDKVSYEVQYNCDCKEKIAKIIEFNNQLKQDFSDINILNKFAEASNLAFQNALKAAGIEEE